MGEELIESLIVGTGLPEDAIERELDELIKKAGINRAEITMEEIRMILSEYLQDVLLQAKDDLEKNAGPTDFA